MIHAVATDTAKAVTLDGLGDLAGATVAYRLHLRGSTDPAITGAATIEDAAKRIVSFPVPPAGRYDAEFQATYSGGEKESAPSWQADVLLVRAQVGA